MRRHIQLATLLAVLAPATANVVVAQPGQQRRNSHLFGPRPDQAHA